MPDQNKFCMPHSDQSVLVHPGFYKSASTWLQKCFFLPEFGYGQILNPLSLQLSLVHPSDSDFDPVRARQEIAAEVAAISARGLQPVLSSEAFAGDLLRGGCNSGRNTGRIGQVLEARPRILLVVREQRRLLRSVYKTLVFFGADQSLRSLLKLPAGQDERRFHPGFLQFQQLAERYRELFGADALRVLPYEWFCQEPRAFLDAVRAHSNLAPLTDEQFRAAPVTQIINANESLLFIETQRWLNRLNGTAKNDYRGRKAGNDFDRVMRRIAWHKRNARATPLDELLERRFTSRVKTATAGMYGPGNRRIQAFCPVDLEQFGYDMEAG